MLCNDCYEELNVTTKPVCRRCAELLPNREEEAIHDWPEDCPCCREEKWHFDETIALGPYEGLLRYLVLQSKKQSGSMIAKLLGTMLAEHNSQRLKEFREDAVVVPIPSHWTRRIARGGNGPDQLAKGFATARSLPVGNYLKRTVRTAKQTELPPHRRKANVRSAFEAKLPPQEAQKTILLLDDVFTTGSTASEASRALKKAGARRVVLVVVAKRVGWN